MDADVNYPYIPNKQNLQILSSSRLVHVQCVCKQNLFKDVILPSSEHIQKSLKTKFYDWLKSKYRKYWCNAFIHSEYFNGSFTERTFFRTARDCPNSKRALVNFRHKRLNLCGAVGEDSCHIKFERNYTKWDQRRHSS